MSMYIKFNYCFEVITLWIVVRIGIEKLKRNKLALRNIFDDFHTVFIFVPFLIQHVNIMHLNRTAVH
jgi:hypothetical protein